MKHTLFLFPTLVLAFAALAQPSPNLPPTRLAPGSGVTITTNGVNNFTIAASGGSSVTNLGNGSNTLLATNLTLYGSAANYWPLTVYGTNGNIRTFLNQNTTITFTNTVVNVPMIKSDTFSVTDSTGAREGMGIRNASGTTVIGNFSQYDGLSMTDGLNIGWSSAPVSALPNTGLTRAADRVAEINNGTAGAHGDLRLRTVLMPNMTNNPSTSATYGQLYVKDVAGTVEVFVLDGAGNATQISPHARASSPAPADLDAGHKTPVVLHHVNVFTGEQEWLHLSAMAAELEKLTGKKFIYKTALPPDQKQDWDIVQQEAVARSVKERSDDLGKLSIWQASTNANKGPQPSVRAVHEAKPKPAWLNP